MEIPGDLNSGEKHRLYDRSRGCGRAGLCVAPCNWGSERTRSAPPTHALPGALFEIKDESLAKGGVPGAMGGGGADAYLIWGRPGPLLGLVSSPVK